ncbi:MAG: RagB/SusD family nutrient uptake outer membrane protein [Marinilabiliales bacterium]|nr:RagB/SusD family nutrient uptake outer membrane protein [Marinilabiliales bacterium]
MMNSTKVGPAVTYAFIRECNIFLDYIDKGSLSPDKTKTMKGEVHFWRAWNYFTLVRTYGGVPIVMHAQNAILGDSDPRRLTWLFSAVQLPIAIKLIVADLDTAISMLPGKWDDPSRGASHPVQLQPRRAGRCC